MIRPESFFSTISVIQTTTIHKLIIFRLITAMNTKKYEHKDHGVGSYKCMQARKKETNKQDTTVPIPCLKLAIPFLDSYRCILCFSTILQSGEYDLVATIVYEIDQHPYQNTFYNGTIEVTEAGGMFSVESVFLFCLGIALLGLLGFWIRNQIQHLSKKTKRAPKVEVGTGTTDGSMDEWLQGTAYTQSQSNKSKKKK